MSAGSRLIDSVLPPGCAVCGVGVVPGPPLCPICESRLRGIPPPRCARCGATATGFSVGTSCEACDSWPAGLHAAASAVLHHPPADQLVAGLKYRGWTALAPVLAGYMKEPLGRLTQGRRAVLVPVPLSRRKLRKRGFNQAVLLAEQLATLTGMSCWNALVRPESGSSQAKSGRSEREANVHGAFRWDAGGEVKPGELILVDDVLTTGATAAACSIAVEAAGRSCGGIVTFSRSLPRVDELGLSE